MFSALKRIASPVYSVAKRIVAPIAFSVGRVGSCAGSALFGIQYVIQYFTSASPTAVGNMFIQITAMIANMWVNLVTRVPPIVRQFRSQPPAQAPLLASSQQMQQMPAERPFIRGANARQMSIYLFFKLAAMISGLYGSLGFYLGGITLAEFVADIANSDAHDAAWKEGLVQSVALYFALSNLVSFYTYTLKSVEDNALALGEHLDGDKKLEREAVIKTLLIATWGIVSGTMLGFFSYGRAFDKIKKFIKITDGLNKILSGAGSFFSLMVACMTQLPSLYRKLRHATPEDRMSDNSALPPDTTRLKILRNSTLFAGALEAASMGAQNGMGVINASNELWKVDRYGNVIIPAGICSASTAIAYWAFNVLEGVERTINHIKKDIPDSKAGYDVIHDVETGLPGSINDDPNSSANTPAPASGTDIMPQSAQQDVFAPSSSPLRSHSLLAAQPEAQSRERIEQAEGLKNGFNFT